MRAQVETVLINEAVKVITRLAPPVSGAITLESTGAVLKVHSQAELSRCSVTLPCEVEGEMLIAVPTEAISAAVKGHDSVELELKQSLLRITDGAYNTRLTTQDALELEIEEDKSDAKVWKVSAEQLAELHSMVKAVALKPVANMATSIMPISIRLTKKGAFVACYDANRMCFMQSKDLVGDLDITVPLDLMSAVLDSFKGASCTIKVTDSLVYVQNPVLDVVLALPASDEDAVIDTDMVQEKAREVRKVDGTVIEIVKKDIMAFMDNARAVATKERSELAITTDKGKIGLLVKTTNGVSKTSIGGGVNAKLSMKADFEFLDETLRKCSDQVQIKFVDDAQAFIMVKAANGVYSLVALNQD
ncbi:beta clamp protein [Burkholderia phage BcepSauron]|uniref:Beta clamp protein n=1 Tax=Burkholderia phage BcepSauron TaxID=2530033 RepID=A0A482MN88_9CAUD|nr:beta clamp protein [Burkholderia phage BcepSauron]QBQ74682.1 beta clamp protein [Burkholderia phage BcepSauron]